MSLSVMSDDHNYFEFHDEESECPTEFWEETVFSERELMFMFAICRRPSVCLSAVCRHSSVCRLSSVCNLRAPYSAD